MNKLFGSKRLVIVVGVVIAFALAYFVLASSVSYNGRVYSVFDACRIAILYYRAEHPGEELGNPFVETASQKVKKALGGHPLDLTFHWGPMLQIFVPVNFGDQTASFMLDTGATQSLIWKDEVARLAKLDALSLPAGPNQSSGLEFCHVPEMQIGPIEFQNITMYSPQKETVSYPGAGLFGANILRMFTVTIDYKTKHVILADPNDVVLLSKDAVVVPLIERDRLLCVENVTLNGRSNLTAMLDTGMWGSMVFGSVAKSVLNHPISYSDISLSGDFDLGGRAMSFQRFEQLQIGQLKVVSPIFCATPGEQTGKCDLLLGNDFFSHFGRVTFDYRNKRAIFEPCQTNEPTAPELLSLGFYYLTRKDPRAIATFHKVFDLDNNLVSAQRLCAVALSRQGQFKQAIAESDKILALNPKDTEMRDGRAFWHLQLGENRKAFADYDKAISLDPRNASAYLCRGYGFKKLGQFQKALADCDQAISLNAKQAEAYRRRGEIYERLGKKELAEKDKQMAKQLALKR